MNVSVQRIRRTPVSDGYFQQTAAAGNQKWCICPFGKCLDRLIHHLVIQGDLYLSGQLICNTGDQVAEMVDVHHFGSGHFSRCDDGDRFQHEQ